MRRARLIALAWLALVAGAGCPDLLAEGGAPRGREGPARDAAALAEAPPAEGGAGHAASSALCAHQRRADLGVPAHRERGGRGGFVRMPECARLTVIEESEGWLRVAFPEVEGRTEGWVSRRYAMDCGACGGEPAPASGSTPWPPAPEGQCLGSGATGRERLAPAEPADRATHGGSAKGRAGARVTVVSYNVWELYDGVGEPSYLAEEAHGGAPAAQVKARLAAMARGLRSLDADVLVLQEVEGAALACALAGQAWPGSGWSCAASASHRGGHPQNVAIASRLEGTFRLLEPAAPAETGARAAVELSIKSAGGLTVTGVHLKSSRGEAAHEDCRNARQRMGMAAALASRYEGWSSVLVVGDFNVDPLDTGRAIYDRTDDVLAARAFARLCPTEGGCSVPTWRGRSGSGSAIDLAFFRGGGRWAPGPVRVLGSAPHLARTRLGSDHFPLVVTLAR